MHNLESQVTAVTVCEACYPLLLACIATCFPPGIACPLPVRSEFVKLHINPAAAESDTFCFQSQPLLDGRVTPQLDLPARSQYALPGKSVASSQHARYNPRGARITGDLRNTAVS